ncbi:MAG: hypothetical protein QMD10_10450, partial [Desulfitobacteriaceae bacterium]|nr:hypothetical protein [Desulfitobacteriaceae bacterium]
MKKAFLIALVVPLFFIAFCGVAFADTYTVNVLGESYTFDTGNGADGDVVLRLKPGNPSVAELLVNGTLKATTSSTTTIKKNVLEKNGEPLNSRSDITVRVFNIEDIVQYLPVNKTYDPSNDTPGSGSMPSLNNLTVENGVMLRAATKPLHFRVKGTLTVNGYLMSQHGSAGTAGGYQKPGNPGGSAKNIIILAGSVVVNNGYNSAIFGGFGGGGGGSGWYGGSGGNGGDGGSVTIYCNNLTNTGEIHGGSGGGGGVAFSDYSPGGQGGKGGSVLIVANNFNNTGKIMSGMYGGDGTQSEYLPAYGGYGAGGNLYSNGGTGGDPGGSVYGPPNYPQSGAGFGVEGTSSNLHSSNNCGSLRILVGGSYINSGKFGIGYSSVNIPYTWNYRGLVEIKTNVVLGELDPAAILTHIMNNTRYLFPNLNHLVFQNFYQNNFRLSFVAKNISVKDTISVD